ncbi:hypothetical protein FEK35_27250 [Nocardia cyriacigeorgica]|uniref:Uncharacterized protein n=1 Tax=Nocardia cyriacigeorgica TaxID=135487 RepID=A0A5R8P6F8_9NOCA|nr:hypothetical protein [Nocardia cyriacigeorgica]TLF96791.1 hypothetical protein FEK35_27250 [Nocardia cyriacigeorgica]
MADNWFEDDGERTYVPLPDGRIPLWVMLTVGEEAHAITPWHNSQNPMRLSAAAIAADCSLPVSEVAGREYIASGDEHGLRDFQLVDDPRI